MLVIKRLALLKLYCWYCWCFWRWWWCFWCCLVAGGGPAWWWKTREFLRFSEATEFKHTTEYFCNKQAMINSCQRNHQHPRVTNVNHVKWDTEVFNGNSLKKSMGDAFGYPGLHSHSKANRWDFIWSKVTKGGHRVKKVTKLRTFSVWGGGSTPFHSFWGCFP